MPITFRCEHCEQLMRISRRQAGTLTTCPRCQQETRVPEQETRGETTDSPSHEDAQHTSPLANTSPSPAPTHPIAKDDETDFAEEFQLRRPQTDFEELDLTPMVDVTFLLLIFFMITASFSLQKSIEVPTPEPDQQGASRTIQPLDELKDQSILVEIDAENRFYLETEEIEDPRDLPARMAEIRSQDAKHEVIIQVDEASHHQSLVTVIDSAEEIGLQRIRWGVKSAQ